MTPWLALAIALTAAAAVAVVYWLALLVGVLAMGWRYNEWRPVMRVLMLVLAAVVVDVAVAVLLVRGP